MNSAIFTTIGTTSFTTAFPLLIAGGALLTFGFFYVLRQFIGYGHERHMFAGHHYDAHEPGPHGGLLVDTEHGSIELSIFEAGVSPRFRLFFTNTEGRKIPPPTPWSIALKTLRTDATRHVFTFKSELGYLESNETIPEPHEFTVFVALKHGGHVHKHKVKFIEDPRHGEQGHNHAAEAEVRPPTNRAGERAG